MRRFTSLHKSLSPLLCAGLILGAPTFAGPAGASAHKGHPPTIQGLSVEETGWETGTPLRSERITLLLKRAVDDGLISGGVVLVGDRRGIVSVSARGRLGGSRQGRPLSEDNLFDLASLTKVVATAPAIMKLVDDGEISLSDPLARWFPEFRGSRHAKVTILDLLTHTSGLADLRVRRGESLGMAVRKAAAERVTSGRHHFNYADINFILLGELVHRVSGKPLDVYCREKIFLPLGMRDTMFRPPEKMDALIAPTGGTAGVVQDLTARRFGRVAGHAGLFSSARDLSRFARMMLGGGELDGRRFFSHSAILQMTSPRYIRADAVSRGLGWDISSRYSAPKSRLFSPRSFGHTGYSGSSIWIDPQGDLFVILLTIRQNYRSHHVFNLFREEVSTVAASQFEKSDSVRRDVSRQELSQIGREVSNWERQRHLARVHLRARYHRRFRPHTRVTQAIAVNNQKASSKAHGGRRKV